MRGFATVGIVLVLLSGCNRGGFWAGAGDSPLSSIAGGWWAPAWSHRRQLTVTHSSTSHPLRVGYSLQLVVDHAGLVTAGRSRVTGDDLRIIFASAAGDVELDRVLETPANDAATEIWFPLVEEVAAGEEDVRYFLYYGNPGAGAPPSDPLQIYPLWDDFEDVDFAERWTVIEGDWLADATAPAAGQYALTSSGGGAENRRAVYRTPAATLRNVVLDLQMRGDREAEIDVSGGVRVAYDADFELTDCHVNAGMPGPQWHLGTSHAGTWNPHVSEGAPASHVWYDVQLYVFEEEARIVIDGAPMSPASGWQAIGTDADAAGDVRLGCWYEPCSFDDVKARHFVRPEPTVTAAEEEAVSG